MVKRYESMTRGGTKSRIKLLWKAFRLNLNVFLLSKTKL